MKNDKSRAMIMALAGVYLIYLGVTLIQDVIGGQAENMILLIVAAVLFIAVGVFVIISKARMIMRIQVEEAKEAQEAEEQESEEVEVIEEVEEDNLEGDKDEIIDTDVDAFGREVETILDEIEKHNQE